MAGKATRKTARTSLSRSNALDFGALVIAIRKAHEQIAAQACRAVNISLTLRNWVIGCYIREYEQRGADRAQYGQDLLDQLSQRLQETGTVVYHPRELRRCREFYATYPRIRGTLSPEFDHLLPPKISKSLPMASKTTAVAGIRGALSPKLQIPVDRLIRSLSFSHFAELITVEDPLTRAFYELECIRGNWSVRELKRQIGSLYFERSGLSKNPKKLAALVQASAESDEARLAIRDPYVFEFLGLKPQEVMGESNLEDSLLDRLQAFLIELGHGFCFEARQKRILIGETYGFIDLVFYHRVLKCHVLIELKVADFNHEHLGQLNTYVSWFKRHIMTKGDNPPIGLLLCTRKDHSLVKYALADLPNRLFVSKYQLELPSREQLQHFLDAQIKEAGDA